MSLAKIENDNKQLENRVQERTCQLADAKEAAEWAKNARVSNRGTIIGYQGEKRKVLVVDDKWKNRSVIVNLLSPIGFKVVEATNGKEGLEKATQLNPNLIITDFTD